jgi:prepilin-type processing-associated H-X9-DG protein
MRNCKLRIANHVFILLGFLSLGVTSLAKARAGKETPSAENRAPNRAEEVRALAPADASFLAYLSDVPRWSDQPVLNAASKLAGEISAFLNILASIADGAAMLAVSGNPIDPGSRGVTFAAATSRTTEEAFDQLEKRVVPEWNRSTFGKVLGAVSFHSEGGFGHLKANGPFSFSMMISVRDGLMFGSTDSKAVNAWLAGEDHESFFESNEFARLTRGWKGGLGALVYLNIRPLRPFVTAAVDKTLPGAAHALGIDSLENLAFILPVPAPTAEAAPDLRFALGFTEIRPGFWRLLAPAFSRSTLASVYPAGTMAFLQSSMDTLAGTVGYINAILERIDPEIVAEFEQERSELRNEIGFDPVSEFLANFTDEWAFGVTPDAERSPLLTFLLRDPSAFRTHLRALELTYDLKISSSVHQDLPIYHAPRPSRPFSYAIKDSVLFVSPSPRAIILALDAAARGESLSNQKAFVALRQRVDRGAGRLLFIQDADEEVSQLSRLRAIARQSLNADGSLALAGAITPFDRMIAVEVAARPQSGQTPTNGGFDRVAESIKRARRSALRGVITANMQGILMACQVYAQNHGRQWPPSLEFLIESGSLGTDENVRKLFANPHVDQSPSDSPAPVYYRYRYIADAQAVGQSGSEVVVLSEPEVHDGGALFGFLDGHVEWVGSPKAEELLKILRGGQ